jgi:hypothetical protein
LGRLLAIVLSSATGLWKLFRDQAERDSGIGLKLFGFIAESVFTIIPESCSGSPRNAVRNHPGIAFILDRIPQRPSNDPRIACEPACDMRELLPATSRFRQVHLSVSRQVFATKRQE